MRLTSSEKDIIIKKADEICEMFLETASSCGYELEFQVGTTKVTIVENSVSLSAGGVSFQYRKGRYGYNMNDSVYGMMYSLLKNVRKIGGIDGIKSVLKKEIEEREAIHEEIVNIGKMEICKEAYVKEESTQEEENKELNEKKMAEEKVNTIAPDEKNIACKVLKDIEENLCSLTMSSKVNPNAIGDIIIYSEFDAIIIKEKVSNFMDKNKCHEHCVRYNLKDNEIRYTLDGKDGDFDAMYQATNVSQKYKVTVSDVAEYIMKTYFTERASVVSEHSGAGIRFKPFKNAHYE